MIGSGNKSVERRTRTFWSLKAATIMAVGLWFTLTAGTAGADELVMKNGDHLQGEVVSMSLGKLVFKTSYAGDITIKWEEVATLTTDEPFEAYLKDEERVMGKIKAREDGALVLDPADGSPSVPIKLAEVKSLDRPKPPPGWEFTGNISAGASKETGNTNTEKYNLIGNLTVSKLPHVVKLYGEFRKEWSSDKLSKDNALGSATYERFLDDKWFVFGNATAQTDKFKDLDLLGNMAIGPGYQFWRSDQKNLSVRLAPAYAYEKYSKPMKYMGNKSQRDYFAGYWALDFDMWFFDKFFQVYHHDDIVYSFQDSDNWVVRTRTGIRIPMVLKLFASLQFNYEYDNQPADGKKNYDTSWNFGLGWAF
jgi:putative salt-induced outer membrane protein YdiY